MSVVPTPEVRKNHSQGPWDRRNVAELSQTNFRTVLRGFDRDEVRAILESVAADYRVLQLQNASRRRQLADLEAVLQAYQRADHPAGNTGPMVDHASHQARDEARTILMEAHLRGQPTVPETRPAPVAPPVQKDLTPLPVVPVAKPARDSEWRDWIGAESIPGSADPIETVEMLLKSIDQMLVEIPALPGR